GASRPRAAGSEGSGSGRRARRRRRTTTRPRSWVFACGNLLDGSGSNRGLALRRTAEFSQAGWRWQLSDLRRSRGVGIFYMRPSVLDHYKERGIHPAGPSGSGSDARPVSSLVTPFVGIFVGNFVDRAAKIPTKGRKRVSMFRRRAGFIRIILQDHTKPLSAD